MDIRTLEQGRKIQDQIKDLDRVLEHFLKISETELPNGLSNYLISCNNLGTGNIRSDIAKNMLDCTKQFLSKQLDELRLQFEEL